MKTVRYAERSGNIHAKHVHAYKKKRTTVINFIKDFLMGWSFSIVVPNDKWNFATRESRPNSLQLNFYLRFSKCLLLHIAKRWCYTHFIECHEFIVKNYIKISVLTLKRKTSNQKTIPLLKRLFQRWLKYAPTCMNMSMWWERMRILVLMTMSLEAMRSALLQLKRFHQELIIE